MVMIFLSGLVDALQRGIERGRFAAARGSRDQENAVRQRREMLHARQHVLVETQRSQIVEIARRAIEQAHHDAFAVERGQRGNAQIDFAPQDLILMRPSCGRRRSAMFSLRHQLHARNDGGLQLARRRVLIEQHAVHAVADAEFLFERLDVNIAGALLHGLRDHGVHQADDRRFAGHVAQMFQVFVGFARGEFQLGSLLLRLARSSGRWRREFPARARAPAPPSAPCKQRTVAMVSKSSGSAIASVTVWSSSATGKQRNWRRNRGDSVSVSGETAGGPSMASSGHLQLLRQRGQHVAQRDEAQIDQNLAQLIAALALQFERAVQVLASDQVLLDQDFAKPHGR